MWNNNVEAGVAYLLSSSHCEWSPDPKGEKVIIIFNNNE